MFRRMLTKWPHLQHVFARIATCYFKQGEHGILYDNVGDVFPQPAPPPGGPDRQKWRLKHHSPGPCGLILPALHHGAAFCDIHALAIRTAGHIPLHIMQVPWQHLRTTLVSIGVRARNLYATKVRTALRDQGPICRVIFQSAIKSAQRHENDNCQWTHIVG